MRTNPFEIVPYISQEKRYDGKLIIWTVRSNKSERLNAWFGYLERELENWPENALVFACFDFASWKLHATPYFRQRLAKLAERGAANFRGRIAIAQSASVLGLISGNGWKSDISAAFPNVMVDIYGSRDDAIAWLVSGYERAYIRR